jgi:hypothetical protein
MIAVLASVWLAAAAADCPTVSESGASMSFSIDLAGRPGVPAGVGGETYLDLPIAPRIACPDTEAKPPRDILRGEPGDLLAPVSR